jgi:hypothetical protein
MTRTLALAGIVALALGRYEPSANQQRRPIDLEASDCSSVSHMFGDFEVARATLHQSIPASAGPLDIRPDANGGVHIERGSGGTYEVTACVGAGAATRAEAQAAADAVRLDVTGGHVRVAGGDRPSSVRSWSVQLFVTAPIGASIDVETSNGPIGVRDFSGTLDLRATNGPIALDEVAGTVKARANNGPISVRGSQGEFDVQTANGPIDVRLDGRRWDGHLTARADNGPLSVAIPSGFESSVEVRSSAHSPWTCRASSCGSSSQDDDRRRTLRLGSGPLVVDISTVNGPVTIADR